MAFAGFQTGQINSLTGLPYRSFQEVQKANPQAVFLRYLQPRGYNLHFSQARGAPLTDVRVRRALVMAIDRDEINKISARGEGEWSPPGAMHGLFTEPEVRQLLKRDPEQARRLLAEAGYGSGLTLEWPFNNDLSQEDLAWFQLVQAQWSRVGVSANLVPMELVTHRAKRRAGDFDVDFSVALGALEGDADFMMTGSWHSKGSVNYNKVKDPELDKLLEAQRQEVDPEKRRERQRQAVRRLVDQAWSTAVIYPPKWDVVQPYLKGYYPRFSAHGPFVTAWLDK